MGIAFGAHVGSLIVGRWCCGCVVGEFGVLSSCAV
jgi:hypothetical protein